MSASLVGSEMCIRDSLTALPGQRGPARAADAQTGRAGRQATRPATAPRRAGGQRAGGRHATA
eukprot:12983513-Alexandrium_andersonii.AAC.1